MIIDFLTLCAFLNASDIGEDLVRFFVTVENESPSWRDLFTSSGAWDLSKYRKPIAELSTLSLVERQHTESTALHFSLHSLVARWLKMRIAESRRVEFTMEATKLIAKYIDEQDQDKLPLETKQHLLAHMDACLRDCHEFWKDFDIPDDFREN